MDLHSEGKAVLWMAVRGMRQKIPSVQDGGTQRSGGRVSVFTASVTVNFYM